MTNPERQSLFSLVLVNKIKALLGFGREGFQRWTAQSVTTHAAMLEEEPHKVSKRLDMLALCSKEKPHISLSSGGEEPRCCSVYNDNNK